MRKICYINNMAPLYGRDILLKMNSVFGCGFAFGEKAVGGGDIESIDPKELTNFLGYLGNTVVFKKPFYWQNGTLKLLREDFDDYIVIGDPFCLSVWALLLLKKFYPKKRIYFWTHGWYGKETFLKKVLKKIFFRLADGILLYGNYARGLMIKEGFKPEKLFVIHNSLAYSKHSVLRKSLKDSDILASHFANGNKTLIFTGRLTKVKKLDMILRAMAKLRGRGLPLNLVLVGDGSERKSLEALAEKLSLSKNVWFYGACYDEDQISKLMFNADLCVSPGNVGLTAIHALSFGCPVLTHDNFPMQMPEFEAVKEGVTGAFFKYEDEDSLAEAAYGWLSEARDRDAVRRACYAEIDESWNPDYQIGVIKKALGI